MSKSLEIVSYEVELEFYEPLIGGNPYSDDLLNEYVEALQSGEGNPLKRALRDQGVVTEVDIRKFLKKATNSHFHDSEGAYLKPYHVRAMLTGAAVGLGLHGAATGRLRALIEGLQMPPRIYIDGELRFRSRAVQPIMRGRRQGTIAILEEAAPGTHIRFTLGVVADRELTEDRLRMLFEYAGKSIGLGAHRKLDSGRFNLGAFQEGPRRSLGEVTEIPDDDEEGLLPELVKSNGARGD